MRMQAVGILSLLCWYLTIYTNLTLFASSFSPLPRHTTAQRSGSYPLEITTVSTKADPDFATDTKTTTTTKTTAAAAIATAATAATPLRNLILIDVASVILQQSSSYPWTVEALVASAPFLKTNHDDFIVLVLNTTTTTTTTTTTVATKDNNNDNNNAKNYHHKNDNNNNNRILMTSTIIYTGNPLGRGVGVWCVNLNELNVWNHHNENNNSNNNNKAHATADITVEQIASHNCQAFLSDLQRLGPRMNLPFPSTTTTATANDDNNDTNAVPTTVQSYMDLQAEIREIKDILKGRPKSSSSTSSSGSHNRRKGISRKQRTKLQKRTTKLTTKQQQQQQQQPYRSSTNSKANMNRQYNHVAAESAILQQRLEECCGSVSHNFGDDDDDDNTRESDETRTTIITTTNRTELFHTFTDPSSRDNHHDWIDQVRSIVQQQQQSMTTTTGPQDTTTTANRYNYYRPPIPGATLSDQVITVTRRSNLTSTLRIVVMSDTHGYEDQFQRSKLSSSTDDKTKDTPVDGNGNDDDDDGPTGHRFSKLPDADVLIHCGDFYGSSHSQLDAFLGTQDHIPRKIVIRGNHDPRHYKFMHAEYYTHPQPTVITLDDGTLLEARPFCRSRSPQSLLLSSSSSTTPTTTRKQRRNENDITSTQNNDKNYAASTSTSASALPVLDILVTHEPPFGICDLTYRQERVGSLVLRHAVESSASSSSSSSSSMTTMNAGQHQASPPPSLWLCGHIHEGRGAVWHSFGSSSGGNDDDDDITVVVNAACANSGKARRLTTGPVVIELVPRPQA